MCASGPQCLVLPYLSPEPYLRAVLQPALPERERILYAALSPSPEVLPILKSACRTWEDHLWAQVSIICEQKQSSEMFALRGGFWEGGLAAVEDDTDPRSREMDNDGAWEEEVVASLDGLRNVQVQDG